MFARRQFPFLCAAFLALAGCARFESRPLEPAKNLDRFEQRTLAETQLRAFVETNLHRTFLEWPPAEWNLETLTLTAFFFHPDLDAARARWAVADAGKVTAGQRPNPTLSVTPAYNSTSAMASPWLVTANLDLPIETTGKRGYRLAQAQHLSTAARLGIATTAWEVRARLRRALLELWTSQQSATLLERQLATQENLVSLLEGQLAAGALARTDVARERIALEQTRIALADARTRAAPARTQLAAALGLPARALDDVKVSFDAFTTRLREFPTAEARRRALLNRSDVLAALAEYAATESALQLEIAKQYPDVHVNPGYEFDQGDSKWGVGIGIDLPVLNRNRGPIAEAEARRRESAAKFNALQVRVLGEIETATAGFNAARAQYAAAAPLFDQLRQQEQQTQAMLAAGALSRPELVSVQLQRATSELARLDTAIKLQQAAGQLEDALQSPLNLSDSMLRIATPDGNPKKGQSK
ncbi:MAG TPA: TolC family protein [Verrucomicrobiae bacterium]